MDKETQSLQFTAIFRNRFGAEPEDLGLVVDGYTASGNGHDVRLHVENETVIDWKVDGASFQPHKVLQKRTSQATNLESLRAAMGQDFDGATVQLPESA